MKVAVVLMSSLSDHIYGVALVEKKFVSCYCVKDAAIQLVKQIFNDPEITLVSWHNIYCILGGAAPYEAHFIYKLVDDTNEPCIVEIKE